MDSALSRVVDVLPGLIWTALPDGHVDFVNQAWREYTGQGLDEARTPGWPAVVHPDDLSAWLDCWQATLASGDQGEMEARLRRFDGAYHRFVLRVRPLVDAPGEVIKWCGMGTDVQDCAPVEEATDVRDIDLCAIVDSIPAFMGLTGPSGAPEYFNRFALDYLGATHDDLKGWKAAETVHPDDLPSALACWKQAVETGQPYDFVHRIRRADGSYRWFQVRGLPLRDSEGRIARWFIVDADIDEQKRGESLLVGEKQLLEMVARGLPRPEVLDTFCRLVEDTIDDCTCSIGLLDSTCARLEHGAGPSLPPDFINTIVGMSVGVEVGPCPMAARLKERVIAADLSTEERWKATRWRTMAMSYGLLSCWSTPIADASGEALGVFAVYYDRARSPTPQDIALLDQLMQIASNTIERLRSQMALAQALDEIRASEDHLRSIIDAVPGFVWRTGPEGGAEFLNQRWFEYTGMTLDAARGFGWTSAVHPDDAGPLATYWRALLEAGHPGEYEARLRSFDGTYRWFLIRAVPQRDEAGRLVKWHGANTDIEDRKRTELLLAGEKQLLGMMADGLPLALILEEVCKLAETILDGSICSIVLVDPRRTRPSHESEFRLRLLPGAAPHLPASLLMGVDGHVADADADPIALAVTRNEPVMSIDLTQETRWREWSSAAMAHGIQASWSHPIAATSGKAVGVLSILYRQAQAPTPEQQNLITQLTHLADIAIERAHGEAALKQSEAFLAKAQRLSVTGTFAWRVATDEITWSEEIYRIGEIDPELMPSFELVYSRVHPEDAPALGEVFQRARIEGRDFEHEHRLLMPDGRVKHVHLVAHATTGEDGGLEYIAAVQDITQRWLSEEALGKVRSELAHVARVASLGVLTASIAHEVNQPLAGIITNASTCLRMLGADPPNIGGARETARRTIRDGNRASEVVQRLRALFVKKSLSAERFDLNEAAREVIAMQLGELQRNGVTLHPAFAERLPPVKGDRVQLQQVILNLIVNATDAMQSVIDRPRHMWISTGRDEGGRVRFSVVDNGAGFDSQDADRLFQAFYTTKSAGMGIGLSVSRSIIESHGGHLWASANDGPGAIFCFAIPQWSGFAAITPDDGAVHTGLGVDPDDVLESH